MNSLRNRIAALLIASIIAVIALATIVADRTLQPPPPGATIEPLARSLAFAVTMAERDPSLQQPGYFRIEQKPPEGDLDGMLSEFLEKALARVGEPRTAMVIRSPGNPAPMAAIALEKDGWLVAEIPHMGPPPGGWKIFGMWIGLIILGSAAVSVFAASKITRPLDMLENAAASIGPDGSLPHLPETGPGEIRATARALNELASRLKAAMESRMRLVAAAGHDLRTPMTRMRLRAEFIENDEERTKWLADLEELDAIADSAILLVREEVSQDSVQTIDLAALLGEIVVELSDLGHAGALDFTEPDTAMTIRAAPLALKRALRNLMLNAVTHGKKAHIDLTEDDSEIVVTIRDEGPGIPQELIGRVFEPFFRVDLARRKSIPGVGLGLAIAREIIERFGGRITIANHKKQGLIQTVIFNRAA
ncbi:Adaptive-response sensory-kinase SasA [Rhizobium rhizogenes]|uniref:histidine kinase n=1 Tax=Rhizobium rhizogenes TaxID=359 RepID=A0AAN2A703_RHIRH|nr:MULTISPECIES: ATP-binding protein [Rhizobium/Agrobacterium group]AQS65050.1 HAMP domain-containing protein [Rhizobium rhizogenes]MCZ7444638.1 ATP-binding protein [Rhizobium rhizogenes]NSZ80515.1 HAMP domain-containing protein [Agrobacterium tumefaciens]OAM63337.1 two-component sensor histidine kinase [Rhizobium rhizogenes]CAD0214813.1 Adaptive-response sensory-kinase SasA [Rhizobium rhizogenes]